MHLRNVNILRNEDAPIIFCSIILYMFLTCAGVQCIILPLLNLNRTLVQCKEEICGLIFRSDRSTPFYCQCCQRLSVSSTERQNWNQSAGNQLNKGAATSDLIWRFAKNGRLVGWLTRQGINWELHMRGEEKDAVRRGGWGEEVGTCGNFSRRE